MESDAWMIFLLVGIVSVYLLQRQSSDKDDNSAQCPFAFGRKKSQTSQHTNLKSFSLTDLSTTSYISIKGLLFDIRDDVMSQYKGYDVSYALAIRSIDSTDFNKSIKGLSFQQHKRLELYFQYALKHMKCIGKLNNCDIQTILGEASVKGAVEKEMGGDLILHQLVEKNQEEEEYQAIERLLLQPETDIDIRCPRTGLTPLHKAIESGQQKLVDLLITHGADTRKQAALYDNDTAVELANRFHLKINTV